MQQVKVRRVCPIDALFPCLEQERLAGRKTRSEGLDSGDVGEFALFYDASSAAAYALASCIVADAAVAEEVVCDAFLAAWRERRRGMERAALLADVRHRALLWRRSHAPQMQGLKQHTSPELPAWERTTHVAEQTTETYLLREAFVHLLPEQREALELAYLGGLTHVEIAHRLGLPLRTVDDYLRQSLQILYQARRRSW